MGHDIYGHTRESDINKDEIAYLRRGAFDPLNMHIYEALNANEYNASCSGNGMGKTFTKQELMEAQDYLSDEEDLEPEKEFICDCLNNLSDDSTIFIHFA